MVLGQQTQTGRGKGASQADCRHTTAATYWSLYYTSKTTGLKAQFNCLSLNLSNQYTTHKGTVEVSPIKASGRDAQFLQTGLKGFCNDLKGVFFLVSSQKVSLPILAVLQATMCDDQQEQHKHLEHHKIVTHTIGDLNPTKRKLYVSFPTAQGAVFRRDLPVWAGE